MNKNEDITIKLKAKYLYNINKPNGLINRLKKFLDINELIVYNSKGEVIMIEKKENVK